MRNRTPPLTALLGDLDRELLLEFFVRFAKAEYALKRSGYILDRSDRAEPNWDAFASANESRFPATVTPEVREAVNFLLAQPPRKQVAPSGTLAWQSTERHGEPELKWLLLLVRRVRNNLFHGGKFAAGPEHDLARRTDLIRSSILVLSHAMTLEANVAEYFAEAIH